jgi:hypothetical protein
MDVRDTLYLITDKDSKLHETVVPIGWNMRHRIDANHVTKALSRFWDQLSYLDKTLASGLKDPLSEFLRFVLHHQIGVPEKQLLRQNAFGRRP